MSSASAVSELREKILSNSRFSIRLLCADISKSINRGTCKMSNEKQVKGQASYFPSIEAKYGFPIKYWLNLLATKNELKHMEMVAWLKSDHGLGHGHANALVTYFHSQNENKAGHGA